jgi:hypothetical protein
MRMVSDRGSRLRGIGADKESKSSERSLVDEYKNLIRAQPRYISSSKHPHIVNK